MEFISNLIKRPISLVLNDSASEQQHQPHHTTNSEKAQTPPPLTTTNISNNINLTAVEQLQQQCNNFVVNKNFNLNQQHEQQQIAAIDDKSVIYNKNNQFKKLVPSDDSINMNTIDAVVEEIGAAAAAAAAVAATGNYEPTRHSLFSSSNSNSNSSTSSSNTATTIEELLVQINDNLNQAENEQHRESANSLYSAATAHSPLAAKSPSTNKLPQIQTTSTTPKIFLASSLSSPTSTAAGSAVLESSSKDANNGNAAELKSNANPLVKEHLSNEDTGVNKINKFIGLTEFDESKIPELPGSLNPNIEDQLKLTFEENFIPTLTASSIAVLAASSKNDGTSKTYLSPINNDTDTALSSDNETFAECQSFPDNGKISTNLQHDTSDYMSETETFRSALNDNNSTVEAIDDPLNSTLEHVADLPFEEGNNALKTVETCNDVSMQEYAQNVTFDGNETMDVDMDASLVHKEEYTLTAALPVDQMNNSNDKKTILEKTLENDNTLTNITGNHHSISKIENTSINDDNAEKKITAEVNCKELEKHNKVSECDIESQTLLSSTRDTDENKTSLEVTNQESNLSNVESNLNLSHDANLEQNHTATTLVLNTLADVALAASNKELQADINSNKKSPQFPLKQKPTIKHFPSSPVADDKPEIFLEKSEYSEKLATAAPKANPPISTYLSPQMKNDTFNRNEAKSPINEVHLMPRNKSKSPDFNSPTALVKSSVDQLNCTFNSGGSPLLNETINISEANRQVHIPSNDDKNKMNCTFGEMNSGASPHLNETINISEANRQVQIPNNDNFSPSPISMQNSNKMNCTFGASPSESSPQLNETIQIERTDNREIQVHDMPVIDSIPIKSAINKLDCTFDAKDLPSPIELQSINAKNISENAQKRHTFNIPKEINESFEPMEVDDMEVASQPQLHDVKDIKNQNESVKSSENFKNSSSHMAEMLSSKEKSTSSVKDEKDIFIEKNSLPSVEEIFKAISSASNIGQNEPEVCGGFPNFFNQQQNFTTDEEFHDSHNLFLNPSDIEFLYTKGNSNTQTDDNNRSSLLLKFDPLLGKPVPVNQPEQQQHLLQKKLHKNKNCISSAPSIEEREEEANESPKAIDKKQLKKYTESAKVTDKTIKVRPAVEELLQAQPELKDNARMSVDVIKDIKIDNDCNKSIENSNAQLEEKQSKFNMDELEKKIKNEVLKTEDIEKKLKEAEQREEALIKRITEKDKSIVKMNSVIEAYEKAIAELISEKEQIIQNYEKQLHEVKIDRDSNYHHLTSLETTFSDLHVKYEKSKEMTTQLKASEEALLAEKKQNLENLRLQEQRYEKMKNHALQQLDTANRKLEQLTKEHAIEATKLKALLKKEEISRLSINEQLQQKTRENAELVKICDELINGQGS